MNAINTLEGFSYYQGNWTVDDYLDSFLILTSDTRYTDLQTLVVKFRWGLKLNIQSQIATMLFGWPTDTDLGAWYTAAWRINQTWLANKAFQSMLWLMAMAPTCFTLPWSTPFSMFCPPQLALSPIPPRPPPPRPPLPTPSREIPMDIDAAQKTHSLPLHRYYWCKGIALGSLR